MRFGRWNTAQWKANWLMFIHDNYENYFRFRHKDSTDSTEL